ncbi:MAG: glycosyltransferase [Paenibacillaceae bacterium]
MRWSEELARIKGREAGYQRGHSDGYKLGFRDAVMRKTPDDEQSLWDIRVLYVTAGIGVPYPALDQAIIEALGQLVKHLKVAGPTEDVVAIAAEMSSDLVLVLNGVVLPAEKVDSLRNHGYKTAVWFTDDPYYTDWTITIAKRYDYVFTLELACVSFYREAGCQQVYYLPFATNSAVFQPMQVNASYQSDICLIGTAFWNRIELIDRLTPILLNRKVIISGWWWDRLNNFSKLSNSIKLGHWMTPEETACYYNGAKIIINLHRSIHDDSINVNTSKKIPPLSVNPRTFEIASCGAFQLSDFRPETDQLYSIGTEIVTFTSHNELKHKIDYYLRNEEERQSIALNGLARTRRDHTYHKRLSTMLSILFPLS